jgi:hypothetical protein
MNGEEYWFNQRYADLMFSHGMQDAKVGIPPQHPTDPDYMMGYNE